MKKEILEGQSFSRKSKIFLLREALQPLANLYSSCMDDDPDYLVFCRSWDMDDDGNSTQVLLTIGDMRRAVAMIEATP
ncbi:MAG: hypothetical protein LC793_07330 [Thermomicrobia bacterium]|nr:hypothetical protein [Thermomicrobia bacterium]